jgi:hypothetical protein
MTMKNTADATKHPANHPLIADASALSDISGYRSPGHHADGGSLAEILVGRNATAASPKVSGVAALANQARKLC